MRFRTYKNTDLTVSEVGFGLWTISTGWWGNFTEGEAIALMHKAFDLGVTLFDAADTYGNGLSEELIAKAFPNQRDDVVIATKVGYDFVHYGEARGRGQREIPQDFSPDAIIRATDAALKRLKTDRIDLLQLHNIRMEQVYDDAVWTALEKLDRKSTRLNSSHQIIPYAVFCLKKKTNPLIRPPSDGEASPALDNSHRHSRQRRDSRPRVDTP